MRAINKQNTGGGRHLARAHATPPQTKDQASSRWKSFQPHKAELLAELLQEQYFLCCYSEIRADLYGLGYHIEHVQPKSSYPQRTFDYQNLAASALASTTDLKTFKQNGEAIFAGHAKASQYDPAQFISCHQADCARFFAFLSDGRVLASRLLNEAEAAQASYTIDLLNLNSPVLVTYRRNWWGELDRLFEQHQQDNWSMVHLAMVDLLPKQQKLSPFFSLTRQFFGSIAEQVLQQPAAQPAT